MPDEKEVLAALQEMHGLIHEAMSNVELDRVTGHALTGQIQSVVDALRAGRPTDGTLRTLLDSVRAGVSESAAREREKDNPIAAVGRVEEIIAELGG
ncbi:MAG: hypothetical protein AB1752_06230 [Candidatus Zixiibacteriota bacterium]